MGMVVGIEDFDKLDSMQRYFCYNAADTTGTLEIVHTLRPRLTGSPLAVYNFERALQNPAFTMMRRGIKINPLRRNAHVKQSERELEAAIKQVDEHPIIQKTWDGVVKETGQCPVGTRKDKRHRWQKWPKGEPEDARVCEDCGAARLVRSPFNANSSSQCQRFFYELLGCKPLRNKAGNVSADEEVLQRLQKANPKYHEVIGEVLSVRKLAKEAGFLKARISPAGRWHASFNVGATLSGRWSSSKNPQGMGNNAQNVSERHRDMFEADPGYELAYADLKQAESMVVAYLAEDEEYMEAHHTGDVHTYVTRYIFPDYAWTNDIYKDKEFAKNTTPDFDKEHDLRHHGKRNTHGYPYGVSPAGTARIARIPLELAESAHKALDKAFPNIKGVFHPEVIERVANMLPLVTPVGRPILLLGRPNDPATYRKGYASVPQSLVSDLVTMAIYSIWRDLDPHLIQVLGNAHDAIVMQWRKKDREEAIKDVVRRMEIPVQIKSRMMTIPVEVSVGTNWRKKSKDNPDGQVTVHG